MTPSSQIDRFGSTEYGIVPYTYILPREMESLEEYLEENPEAHVIIKPVRLLFHVICYTGLLSFFSGSD